MHRGEQLTILVQRPLWLAEAIWKIAPVPSGFTVGLPDDQCSGQNAGRRCECDT
jgi:hypothetical protein